MRIAIGGFQHETNTFAPSKASFDEFARGGAWPPLLRGGDIFDGTAGINLPVAGFVDAMRKTTHQLVPTAWAAASPSAHVTEDAYERISGMIVDALKSVGQVDAVYLDLHGAMVTEHLNDGEGELLARVRAVVGSDIPVVASLDLHANVTQRMLEHADALIAYRTYPHIDMAETGGKVARLLQQRLSGAAVAAQRAPRTVPDPAADSVHDARASQVDLRGAGAAGRQLGDLALLCARLPGGGFLRVRTDGHGLCRGPCRRQSRRRRVAGYGGGARVGLRLPGVRA
jgi:microcystin degradation protein MlrC